MDIVKNIIEIRKKKGVKQELIADALNIDVSAISNIEKGKRELKVSELEKIANALNIDVLYLFTYPDIYDKNEDLSVVLEPQVQYGKSTTDEIIFLRKIIENQQKELDNKQRIIENQQKELDNKQRTIDKQLNTIEAYERGEVANISRDSDVQAPKKGVG